MEIESAQEDPRQQALPALQRRGRIGLLTALALLAVVYGATLFPGPGGRVNVGDSAKFQYIGEILGVPHPPGYPQYVVLNFLWTRMPLPLSLATRVNLLSAFLSLVAAGFLYSTLWRLTRSVAAALLATWSVMLTRSVWAFSTEAEVYALHLAYCAALLWAVVRLRQEGRPRWLITAAVLFGLSLGNHPTSVLYLPSLAVLALSPEGRAWGRRKLVLLAVLALAIGLSQYTFLLWRSHSDAPFLEAIEREADLEDLGETLSGSRFTSKNILSKGLAGVADRSIQIPLKLAGQMWVLPVLLAIPGAIVLLRKDKLLMVFFVLSAITFALFISIYHIGDWVSYLAPIWSMVGILAGLGLAAGLRHRRRLQSFATALWGLLLVSQSAVNAFNLHVDTNRWDRDWLVQEAAPGEQVVTYRGPGYRPRQLNNYYRFGVLHSDRPPVLTAVEAIQDLVFLQDDVLIFSSDPVRNFFDKHHVQYSERWSDTGRMYFQTSSQFPIRELTVRPKFVQVNGKGTQVETADGTTVLDGAAPIQVAVIAADGRRLKGVVEFSDRRDRLGPKGAKLETLLRRVHEGDWIVLAVNEAYMARSKKVQRLLGNWSGLAIAPPPTPDEGLLVIGTKGSAGPAWQLSNPRALTVVELVH